MFKKPSIPTIAMLLTFCTGFLYLGNKNFHLDEIASFVISQNGGLLAKKLWNFEGNMWFYYSLLHLWLKLGSSEFIVRSFSVFCGVLTIIPFYNLALKLVGKKAATLSTILLPLHIVFVKNIQFARGYSLQLLLLVLSSYFFIKILEKRKLMYIALYVLVSILAVYTHMYSGLVLVAHSLYVLLSKDKNTILTVAAAQFVTVVAVLPLVISPAFHSGQINWITKPDWYTLAATGVMVTGDFIPLSAVVFVVIAYMVVTQRKKIFSDTNFVFLALWSLIPPVITLLVSYITKPVFSVLYFGLIIPPVLLITAKALSSIHNKTIFRALLSCIVLLQCFRLLLWYTGAPYRLMSISNINTPWKEVSTHITSSKLPGDGVIVVPTYAYIIYDFYAQQPAIPVQPLRLATGYSAPLDNNLIQALPQSYSRIWYVYNKRAGSEADPQKKITETQLYRYYTLKEQKDWFELRVLLLERKQL